MMLLIDGSLLRYTGDGKLNIVVMKIVQLAVTSTSSSTAAADDISPYPSLNALVEYISPRKYQDINLCVIAVF